MDRCALFVDASYALAEGAQTVHGTRNRDSVSWDYPGLVKLLGSLSRDRTGLPLLRCYWYDTSADGNRAAEHDALADIPGVKLRLSKIRPNRKEGVEAEIRKDLTALARNHAVGDVVIVSAEEDLAPVIAEVQDLGIRAVLLTITAPDGSDVVSRALRQECDDLIEVSGAHLRPYADLISGAEPQLAATGYRAPTAISAQASGPQPAIEAPAQRIYASPVAAEFEPAALVGLSTPVPAAGEPGPGQDAARFAAAASSGGSGGAGSPAQSGSQQSQSDPARGQGQVQLPAPVPAQQPYPSPDASRGMPGAVAAGLQPAGQQAASGQQEPARQQALAGQQAPAAQPHAGAGQPGPQSAPGQPGPPSQVGTPAQRGAPGQVGAPGQFGQQAAGQNGSGGILPGSGYSTANGGGGPLPDPGTQAPSGISGGVDVSGPVSGLPPAPLGGMQGTAPQGSSPANGQGGSNGLPHGGSNGLPGSSPYGDQPLGMQPGSGQDAGLQHGTGPANGLPARGLPGNGHPGNGFGGNGFGGNGSPGNGLPAGSYGDNGLGARSVPGSLNQGGGLPELNQQQNGLGQSVQNGYPVGPGRCAGKRCARRRWLRWQWLRWSSPERHAAAQRRPAQRCRSAAERRPA